MAGGAADTAGSAALAARGLRTPVPEAEYNNLV